MPLKGLFFYGYEDAGLQLAHPGVDKKVQGQISVLARAGISCRQIKYAGRPVLSTWSRLRMRLPFGSPTGDCLSKHRADYDGYDFYYIRCTSFLSLPRVLAIRRLRRHNPDAKILYEFWTYPYRKDYTRRWIDLPFLIRDIIYRPLLTRCIDRFVTVSRHTAIAGIPTVRMANGIELDSIRPITPQPEDGAIHIIAVAKISPWHGYDRFLKGMARYYSSGGRRDIILHIAGKEAGHDSIDVLVTKLGLEGRVIMHGFRFGKELDAIYDRCHLGLISLATQDKDIFVHSTLKSREYMAKGLPTIATGMTDVFIGTDYKYNLELPAGERVVDMERVIRFYDSIYGHTPRQSVISEIRAFAERHIDINATMRPVIDYLRDTSGARQKKLT